MSEREGTISALMTEDRRFSPAREFTAQANWSDPEVYQRAPVGPGRLLERDGPGHRLV